MVRAPDGTVTIDATGRAPGRGAYLCQDPACWDLAARKRALEHALGTPIPFDVRDLMTEPNPDAGPAPAPRPETDEGGRRGQE